VSAIPARLAVVGTENSHVDAVVAYLNASRADRPARVVALVGEDSERNRSLAALGGIETVTPVATDLLGAVDGLVVMNRDGALHRKLAEPFLDAGLPVWVDKPLACSTADARVLIDTAERTGAPLTSYSPLRWLPDTDQVEAAAAGIGTVQTVTVSGPADPGSEYGGVFFYGIHPADVAQRLAPGEVGPVTAEKTGETIVVRYPADEVAVTLQLVKADDAGRVPFHATVTGRHGIVSEPLRVGEGYVAPGIDVFLRMLSTRQPPIAYSDLLKPITVLEQVAAIVQ